MLLNCDLGEDTGNNAFSPEKAVMPFIDQASIACGLHAGSPAIMHSTIALAASHNVAVGAHPSYPDRNNFGRLSVKMDAQELVGLLHDQISTLDGIAKSHGIALQYIKPHGALYNDMMKEEEVRATILAALSSYEQRLPLMMLATKDANTHKVQAQTFNVELLFEAFADRAYDEQGQLVPRNKAGSVHDAQGTLAQVEQLCSKACVTTHGGNTLPMYADTLCVHGDNLESVSVIRAIRGILDAR